MSQNLKPKQFLHDGNCFGNYGRWFIQIGSWEYLHRDGVVRNGTCNQNKWTGFFDSEDEALAAIEAYKANPQESVKPVSELLANLRKSSGNAWDDVKDVRDELDDLRGKETDEVTP